MRIFGLLCVRNEAARYLNDCLLWHSSILDDIFVYDDQSDDATATIAENLGAYVEIRPDEVLSFTEHEGEFRQAAWNAFEYVLMPEAGDWVLALDADEFFVASAGPERVALQELARAADLDDCNAVTLHFHEVFGKNDDGDPLVRVDGYWGDTDHPRLFRYQERGKFANRKMGGGSTPTYVNPTRANGKAVMLHYGYYRRQDQERKHAFYTALQNGHNPQHIDSIVSYERTLVPWQGRTPWRA